MELIRTQYLDRTVRIGEHRLTIMKANPKRLILILLVAVVGMVEDAHAFYDPGLQRWINRDPIQELGGLNLYDYVGNNPMNLFDLFGLKNWNCQETQNILDDVKTESLIEAYFNHTAWPWGGAYDFKVNQAGDTFDVNGQTMNADQFGNYVAGYGGQHAGSALGYAGVRVGGIMYDFTDNVLQARGSRSDRWNSYGGFDWDADSVNDIRNGANRAREEQRPPPYIPNPWDLANSSRNQVSHASCPRK